MAKTVTLILKSGRGEDRLPLPEDLWLRVEQEARALNITPKELVQAALSDYLEVCEKRSKRS